MNRLDGFDDEELITRSRLGDQDAFSMLVDKHQETVASICLNMLKNYDDAEDIGQKVFIKLYETLHKFKGKSSLKTYISRMAMNYCLNELKRRQRFWKKFSPIGVGEDVAIEHSNDDNLAVTQALQLLDKKFRAVVVLRSIKGYSTKETAEILGLPEGTVLSRQKRAMEKLKNILTKKLGYER